MPSLVRPDGCRIHYELFGDPGSPVLTMLEGIGADIAGWRWSIPALASELRIVAIDHRGNGASDDPPGACTMTTFVEDALGVLDELGVERAHVYGQSFGGMVAQEAALTHGDRVRTMVLAATHPGTAHAIAVVDRTVPKGKPWRALYAPGFPEAHPDVVAEDRRTAAAQPDHERGQRRQWEAMQRWDAFDRLSRIAVPTLVLHGTEDRIIARGNAELLAGRIPGAELQLLEGAGHVFWSEQPEVADRLILDFIERHRDA
ncbi:MAG TPA: alpha/beta fold hydrolase [Actinomycetota bacterium]|jgi:3-oxoadipate enol-lactonase|nr:alpha/beta fold hydrolase [Actinomycetota bacterium]